MNPIMQRIAFAVFLLCAFVLPISADIKLPRLISDGMVLQRGVELKLWGWADPGENISVDFAGKMYEGEADATGTWRVSLPAMEAGGPYTMTITGKNTVTLTDVLLGDVWFCSGQSNMVHMLNIHDVAYATDIAEADYPEIRQFLVPVRTDLQGPQSDFSSGSWEYAVGEKVRPFSAVAYFFARNLYTRYQVPIGIINASVGGTPIEAWVSEEGLAAFPVMAGIIQRNKDTASVYATNRAAAAAGKPAPSRDRGMLGIKKWFEMDYVPKGWRSINVPGYWEDQGVSDLDGVVWYRKEVDIPATMAGKPARVFLGRIVDADALYINGKLVGNTTYMYPQRRYPIPADVLKAGKNTFVVRVTNQRGKGGFVPDKPYCIFAGKDTVDLKGTWHYKVGEVFGTPAHSNAVPGITIQNQPATLFNAMVAPATDYAVKGVLWYQGESNTDRPKAYAQLLPALIGDWRGKWRDSTLPFLYVQLPGFMDYRYLPSESNWAELRESQRKALSVPNTAMAVAIDLGEWNDIHPARKKEVGERLALLARKRVYGEDIVACGPLYRSHRKAGNTVTISFTDVGSRLVANDGEMLGEFAVAGPDKKFVWATAEIIGDQVVVYSDAVPDPRYVRYAWADNPVHANLYNQEGLPASPFEIEVD